MPRRVRGAWLALVASATLAGCATGGRGGDPVVLEGPTWRIMQVDGADVRAPEDVNLAPHLRVLSMDGEVHGATGCNRFSGRYRATGTEVTFGPLATTRTACPDGALQDQERRIMEILQAADGYRIEGQWLWLMVGGTHRMTLRVW